MITLSNDRLGDLGREFPEWQPWLTVIEQVLREATDTKWEAFVPAPAQSRENKVPLLDGAALDLEPAAVGAWSQRLLRSAYALELIVLIAFLVSLGPVFRAWFSVWGVVLLLGVVVWECSCRYPCRGVVNGSGISI